MKLLEESEVAGEGVAHDADELRNRRLHLLRDGGETGARRGGEGEQVQHHREDALVALRLDFEETTRIVITIGEETIQSKQNDRQQGEQLQVDVAADQLVRLL